MHQNLATSKEAKVCLKILSFFTDKAIQGRSKKQYLGHFCMNHNLAKESPLSAKIALLLDKNYFSRKSLCSQIIKIALHQVFSAAHHGFGTRQPKGFPETMGVQLYICTCYDFIVLIDYMCSQK